MLHKLIAVIVAFFGGSTNALGDTKVMFSPQDNINSELISTINGAQKTIYAAVYMLTDKKIAQALINAKERGVTVEIIVDPISATGSHGKGTFLAEHGIPVFVFVPETKNIPEAERDPNSWDHPAIMHDKFAIIDDEITWTG